MLAIDTRIKLLLFILINFMVFGLKDFVLGSVCFFFICVLSCLMGQKKIDLSPLITHTIPLEDFRRGFELLEKKEALKVIMKATDY